MRLQLKSTLMTFALCLFASTAFAEMDAKVLKELHETFKSGVVSSCLKTIEGGTAKSCDCLGDRSVALLDDSKLRLCTNDDSGIPCIESAIKNSPSLSVADFTTCLGSENVKKIMKGDTKS
jgi:hypothetical protein